MLDAGGQVLVHRNLTATPEALLEVVAPGAASSQTEAEQDSCDQACRRRRDIEGLPQIAIGPVEQGRPFFCDSPPLELLLVDCACALTPRDSAEILIQRQRKKKTADVGVGAHVEKPATQVRKLGWGSPEVIDDEVTVAEPPTMGDKQRDRRVQEFHRINRRRVRRDQMVAVQHDAVINTLGERLGERRLSYAERSVEDDDHVNSFGWPVKRKQSCQSLRWSHRKSGVTPMDAFRLRIPGT
jgi:hypothetical protein